MDPEERRARLDQIMSLLAKSKPGLGLAGVAAEPALEAVREAYSDRQVSKQAEYDDFAAGVHHPMWSKPEVVERLLAPTGEELSAQKAIARSHEDAEEGPCSTSYMWMGGRCRKYRDDLEKTVNSNLFTSGYAWRDRERPDVYRGPEDRAWEGEPRKKAKAKTSARVQDDAPGSRRNR